MKKKKHSENPPTMQEVIEGLSGWSRWKDVDAEKRNGKCSIRTFNGVEKISFRVKPLDDENNEFQVIFFDELDSLNDVWDDSLGEDIEPYPTNAEIKRRIIRFLKLQAFQ